MIASASRLAASKQEPPKVGRKRTTKPPKTLSPIERKFALRLSELVGDNSVDVAERIGVSPDAVRKWCAGRSVPSLDLWPKLAAALKLSDWRDLLPQL